MVREEFGRPGGVQYVAEHGFAFGWLVLGELHVLHVGVVPEVRGQGLGRALMRALLASPGVECAWLEVRTDNTRAIALYRALAFEDVGVRRRYYADGSDALTMRLPSVAG